MMSRLPLLALILVFLPFSSLASPHDLNIDNLTNLQDAVARIETTNTHLVAKVTALEQESKLQKIKISNLEKNANEHKAIISTLEQIVKEQIAKISAMEKQANQHEVKFSPIEGQTNQQGGRPNYTGKERRANQQRAHLLKHVSRRAADECCPSIQAVVDEVSGRVLELSSTVTALQTAGSLPASSSSSGSTYVQWGRSTCGEASSTTVYSGVMGGGFYSQPGAATNHLCLTLKPSFSDLAVPNIVSLLYGAEYETLDKHHDKDPLCAVCRTSLPTTVMIPGTDACEAGWKLQYSGHLMAGQYTHAAASQYICVDSLMESSMHSNANENGDLLYYTVTRCGSLPCDPYVNNKVVTCAVCSM